MFLALRPIADRHEKVVAYALVCRAAPAGAAPGAPPEPGAAQPVRVALERLRAAGVATVTGGRPLHVPATRALLQADDAAALAAGAPVVLRVGASLLDDPATLAACEALARAGVALALDGVPSGAGAALLARAQCVALDARAPAEARALAQALPAGVPRPRLVARGVADRDTRDRCALAGFDLFEGGPLPRRAAERRDGGTDYAAGFRLLNALRNPHTADATLEELARRDVGLAHAVLRAASSAAVGGREVWSLGHALRLLGRDSLYRRVALVLLATLGQGGASPELSHAALTRARMCESLAGPAGIASAAHTLFIVGALSRLDALTGVPLDVLLAGVELAPDVRGALLERADFLGAVLGTVEGYEAARWDDVALWSGRAGVPTDALCPAYLEAVAWARAELGAASAPGAAPAARGA